MPAIHAKSFRWINYLYPRGHNVSASVSTNNRLDHQFLTAKHRQLVPFVFDPAH